MTDKISPNRAGVVERGGGRSSTSDERGPKGSRGVTKGE